MKILYDLYYLLIPLSASLAPTNINLDSKILAD